MILSIVFNVFAAVGLFALLFIFIRRHKSKDVKDINHLLSLLTAINTLGYNNTLILEELKKMKENIRKIEDLGLMDKPIVFDTKDDNKSSNFIDGNKNMWKLVVLSLYKMENDLDVIGHDEIVDKIREKINFFCNNRSELDKWQAQLNVELRRRKAKL